MRRHWQDSSNWGQSGFVTLGAGDSRPLCPHP
ncbi:hypothetical protein QF026_002464 [Streptomyces aurantiacus]|nr:hypothetical protein [Streptomyces aurantiacus]